MRFDSRGVKVMCAAGGLMLGLVGSAMGAGDAGSTSEPRRSDAGSGGQFENPDATRAVGETARRELAQISEQGKSRLRQMYDAGVKQVRDLGMGRASDAQINGAVTQVKSSASDVASALNSALDASVMKWTRALTPRVGGAEYLDRMNAGVAEMKAAIASIVQRGNQSLDDASKLALLINKRPPEGSNRRTESTSNKSASKPAEQPHTETPKSSSSKTETPKPSSLPKPPKASKPEGSRSSNEPAHR